MKEPVLFKTPSELKQVSPALQISARAGETKKYFDELKSGSGRYTYSFRAEEGSTLEVVLFQNGQDTDEMYSEVTLEALSNSKINFTFIQEGSARSEVSVTTSCLGKGAEIEMRGLQNAKKKQKQEFRAHAVHTVPHTKSDLKVWCIAQDDSHSIFNALVTIKEGASFTEAYQKNKNLILSEKATIDTFPKLFIANNEVKCAHGSSTSTLDEDQYYYLQSRGISKDEASLMLVKGFMNQAIDWVQNADAKARITEALGIEAEGDFS